MAVQVSLEPEQVESLQMALAALQAERSVCQRWGIQSVRHTLAIDDLEEILEDVRQTTRQSDRNATPLLALIGRSKPW
jgi:hypothetical protein